MTAKDFQTLIPFDSADASLESVGGKGANLARLTRAGFPVPPGFILATDAYRDFVAKNGLEKVIRQALKNLSADDPQALERASQDIRAAFSKGKLPAGLESLLRTAYGRLDGAPAAVRSSATAEDLPDLSFAGQQDTYLNVVGEEQMLEAVVDCWSSLWTARAIGYRLRNGIDQAGTALAVVVQTMVPSETSGVLFTANPLTGLLSETVIDATFGLGEALVSGQVEPDHYVVDSRSGQVLAKTLGTKEVATRGRKGGGVESIREKAGERQALTDGQIGRLVEAGRAIQGEFGSPQDVEWAFAGDELYILQSRPITSLFPVPQVSFDPLIVWFSFSAVQGMLGPVTPLGQDGIRHVLLGAGKIFGVKLKIDSFDIFVSAGERIWVKVSDVIRNPIGSRIIYGALDYVEPSVARILHTLADDPSLGMGKGRLKFSTLRRLARFGLPVLFRMAGNMLHPEKARARFDARIETYLATARVAPAADRFGQLANTIAFMRDRITNAFPFLLPHFIPLFGPSMGGLNLLKHLSGDANLALEATRGLPGNVTTEMDLALWHAAEVLRADPGAAAAFRSEDASVLAARYLQGNLPAPAQMAIAGFMERYGMRGVGEIDMGQPRWREEPTPVMQVLKSYLEIDPEHAPDALFAQGERAAAEAIEKIVARVRRQPGGWIKEKMARGMARRVRAMMGARESPKFFAIRTMGIARQALLEAGRDFVQAGTLDRPDDLVFLKLKELDALARDETHDWKRLVAGRRAAYEREERRRQVPRLLLSDGRAFYEGLGAQGDDPRAIHGSPVSPGLVEGRAHVVLDPRGARLAPGEILVCPGTDPAWTPLFMAAGGLVMEVGGMMTHGSVVAREYGIPAVVGVHEATQRLQTGQRIRLDGSTGLIQLLDDEKN
jgi:phosphohistidine swiveling domain-containing protein